MASFRAPEPPAGAARRTALVTGSSSGIGVAIARQLGAQGFSVGLTVRPGEDRTVVEALQTQLRTAYGVDAAVFTTDFAAPRTAAPALVHAHVARFGRLDVLVNNAGWGAYAPTPFMRLGTTTADEVPTASEADALDAILDKFHRGMAVNFDAPVLLSYLAARQFAQQQPPLPGPVRDTEGDPALEANFYTAQWGSGRIIMTTSVHAATPLPNSSIYTCAKHALRGLTVFLASELGPAGVTVNAVAPGMIATPQTQLDPADVEHTPKPGLFVPRPGRPSEAAGAIGYLASLSARYTTAQTIYTDGGFILANPQFYGL